LASSAIKVRSGSLALGADAALTIKRIAMPQRFNCTGTRITTTWLSPSSPSPFKILTGQQTRLGRIAAMTPDRLVLCKPSLHRVPQRFIDDRRMVPGEHLPLVRDPPDIDRVAQDPVQVSPTEGF
jgi:hypothetical protein